MFLKSLFVASLLLSFVACKTVSNRSHSLYANGSTDLETIQKNTCTSYVKQGDCILRLKGYEADAIQQKNFEILMPKYRKILADYGVDLTDKGDPSVIELLESAKKYGLSDGEFLALTSYMGPVFDEINAGLRGNEVKWKEVESTVFMAASALTHMKKEVFTGKVYRSEKPSSAKTSKLLATYTPGNIVVELPFLSTSKNEKLRFAESDISQGEILLRYTIVSKSGVAVSDLSPTKSEEEVLFTPGTVFKVIDLQRTIEDVVTDEEKGTIFKADTLNISLEEIDTI